MNLIRLAGFLLFSLVFTQKAFATHIVGGEITYRCLGNSLYEITLTIYRDCYNGVPPFDNPLIIGVYNTGPGTLVQKLLLPYDPSSTEKLPIVLNNPCLVAPPDVCVHTAVYRAVVTLPYNLKGYTFVYQRCCRNKLIRNTVDPLNTGVTFTAEISATAQLECNNAAVFNNWPPVAICVHQPIDFDHSASDEDGDVLRYRLCTPLLGPDSLHNTPNPPLGPPYQELSWVDPPYSLSNVLGGVPLSIDSITGFMTGIPNTLGNFVVGVCVDEYRNDIRISTTRREFQYNVADCGSVNAAFFVPEVICDTLDVYFENHSQNSQFFRWYFDWPDDLSQTSVLSSPVFTYSDTGYYNVMLISSMANMCSDTFVFRIHLIETGTTLTATADPAVINRGESTQLTATHPGVASFSWKPAGSLSDPAVFNPVATPLETTTYTVTTTLQVGCQKTDTVIVRVKPPACDEPFVFFPTGFSPNGDGENDALKMESNIVAEVYWVIFNRWGEKVFEANKLEDAWDGTYKGQPQPAETYGYYYRVRCTDGAESFRKGNVTLLR